MKHFILITLFGLFALLANATPVHDTSPPGASIFMADGTVEVFVQPSFDLQQADVIPMSGLALTTALNLPPSDGEAVNTLQVPRVKSFKAYDVYRAYTIRTQRKMNRTGGYLI